MTIVSGRINGIDVSSIQSVTANGAKLLYASGFRFAYVQSSRYSSTKEGSFERTVGHLRGAGLVVGAYHFCSHDTSPVRQMEFFNRASGGLGSKPGELPPCIDWEFCTPSFYVDKPGGHPKHCVNWLADALMTAEGLWYPNNDNSVIKRYPVTYTFPNYADTHQPDLANEPSINRSPLCFASYKSGPRPGGGYQEVPFIPSHDQEPLHNLPKPWTRWTLWQYSGNNGFKVPGIDSACDRQVFNGTEEEFKEFCGVNK